MLPIRHVREEWTGGVFTAIPAVDIPGETTATVGKYGLALRQPFALEVPE